MEATGQTTFQDIKGLHARQCIIQFYAWCSALCGLLADSEGGTMFRWEDNTCTVATYTGLPEDYQDGKASLPSSLISNGNVSKQCTKTGFQRILNIELDKNQQICGSDCNGTFQSIVKYISTKIELLFACYKMLVNSKPACTLHLFFSLLRQ